MNISEYKQKLIRNKLTKETVDHDPFKQFQQWFDEALKAELLEPNAMVLSTASAEGKPSQRAVLLKYFDKNGFVFFTNYKSKKSEDIRTNNAVSALFSWYGIKRQTAIMGRAEKISTVESARYFLSRPFGSQLGAWISHQSKVISSRSLLETKMEEMKRKFSEGKVPVPDFWGGYKIIPESFEFWQGRDDRLHDRIMYKKDEKGWKISRLSP